MSCKKGCRTLYINHHDNRVQTLPELVFNKEEQWVADVVEMQTMAKWNRGTRYLLTVVDVLSKFAWFRPLKNKTGASVVRVFQSIVKEGGPKPQQLQTDKGKEFYNATVQWWFKQQGIHDSSTEGDAKATVVERLNRTLKSRMHRYFTAANTMKYLDVLPDFVRTYNDELHRSIRMAPQDGTVDDKGAVWHRLYGKLMAKGKRKKRSAFQTGHHVRLSRRVRIFVRWKGWPAKYDSWIPTKTS